MATGNSKLFIGLGLGLLAGAAIGLYLASSEEDKAKFMAKVNDSIDNAKETVSKVVDDGLEQLARATGKASKVAQDNVSEKEDV